MCGREEARRMKLFRRRISRSAVLLFFNMVLVLVSALLAVLIVSAVFARKLMKVDIEEIISNLVNSQDLF